jgi:curved DNA-binding protein
VNFTTANFYSRLGVSRLATTDDIRRAFRALARVYHPDVAVNKSFAEEVFKRLNEAYETLSQPHKRQSYDLDLSRQTGIIPTVNPFTTQSPPRTPARPTTPPVTPARPGPTGFQAVPPPRPRRQPEPEVQQCKHRADLDIEASLEISLEDAVFGATYVITVQQNDQPARRQNLHSCRVQVPAGVYENQSLRLQGLGYVDMSDLAIGDLYLTIKLTRHARYRVLGPHLYTEISITPWEAALGARIRLQTLDGLADLHIPTGSQPGTRLRLGGYGLPQHGGKRGDLLVNLHLKVPVATSEKERELWRAIAAQHGDPRPR